MSRLKTLLVSSMIGTSLLGMPALAWEQETLATQQECIPAVSVSDNTVDNTVLIRVAEGNTCPISDKVFLFIQDNRSQPLKLSGIKENFLSSTWVVRPDGVRSGQYRVMGLNPTPNGIGDNEYISARHLRIDQVITVGGTQGQEQSAPALPQVELPPAPRQESRPEPSQAQGQWASVDLEALFNCFLRTPIRFNGWMIDFSPWKACLPR